MKIILTFTGFHDPYSIGLVGEDEQEGPILSLIRIRSFDRVILFSTPNTGKNTEETLKALKALYTNLEIEVRDLFLDDPTDYIAILRGLREHFKEINERSVDAEYFISVASGTPQMHACWVLLAAGGEIPATILHIRPPKFVTKDRPIVSEVNLTSREFPSVRSNVENIDIPEDVPADFETVVKYIGIVGDHPLMKKALEIGVMLAPSDSPILIYGETGTGKELMARFIHSLSGRKKDNFVPLNCAAIPEELVESILFGHKKGAFTGATNDQIGKFDIANEGTLFLDEIGELPAQSQAKLLRVLEDGYVEPIGAKKPHQVNVRVIGATNRDLRKSIRKREFREDLYYRLNIGEIELPSLRARRSDIPKIALYILDRVNSSLRHPKRISAAGLSRLKQYDWPGNVRELSNVIERSVRLSRKDILEADDLLISEPVTHADPLNSLPEPCEGFFLNEYLQSARKQLILRAIEVSNGKQSDAARLLGITPQAIHKFVHEGNISSKP